MQLSRHIIHFALTGFMALAMAGNAAAADRKSTNTILGAGLGAATGAVLSEGDPMTTLGGAAAGGLLGNILTEDYGHHHWKHHDRSYRSNYHRVNSRYFPGKHHYKKHHKKHPHHRRHH